MTEDYEYYLKIIKPLEKKYIKLCTIYKFTKLKLLKSRIIYLQKLILLYYKSLNKQVTIDSLKNNID